MIPVATNSSSINVILLLKYVLIFSLNVSSIWNCLPDGVDFSSLSQKFVAV